jgi:uncharacterized membrane protein
MATAPTNVRRVRAHPVHGILSAYPLAFFTAAFAADVAYANSAQMQWANFAVWLITGGLLMGALAAIAGIVDALLYKGAPRRRYWPHSVGVLLMMILALFNVFIHSRDGWTSVVPAGLILSAIVLVLALVTSWMGYSLGARQEGL